MVEVLDITWAVISKRLKLPIISSVNRINVLVYCLGVVLLVPHYSFRLPQFLTPIRCKSLPHLRAVTLTIGAKTPQKIITNPGVVLPALVRSVPLCISLHILESPCKLSVSSWKPLLPSSFLNPRFLKAQWNFFFLLASGCYVFSLLFTLQEGFYFATSSGFTVSKITVPQYNTVPCVFSTYF